MNRIINKISDGLITYKNSGATRFFHGRGQLYEGLGDINVDWFSPVLLITLYSEPEDMWWSDFKSEVSPFDKDVGCILVQRRYLRGGPVEILMGEIPQQVLAIEHGLKYRLSFGDKQNIGFFMDMEPGRHWLSTISDGKKVLNLFSYTCSFSVAAIAGGAHSVVNVDMSSAALTVGRENHQLNQHQTRLQRDIQFLSHDIFRSWKKIVNKGPYDIVIIDPPSRQRGSFIADKDYGRVLRRLESLLPKGGDILACLNAPELGEAFLTTLFAKESPSAKLVGRLQNRVDFPEKDSQRSLKMLHYTL
ncbi:MAG: class I SAM-dependent methyltransferase [Oceanicoccus sp.]